MELGQAALQAAEEDVLLAIDVVVERRLGDAQRARDVIDRCALEALRGEKPRSRQQQRVLLGFA